MLGVDYKMDFLRLPDRQTKFGKTFLTRPCIG
jgi:hypothetical protein